MDCPKCRWSTKVLDSRDIYNGKEIRRRRQCESCWYKFTTYERPEITRFIVIKSSWQQQPYDRQKLEDSIIKAITKTNIDIKKIDEILTELELEWMKNKQGVTSERIWKDVLEKLQQLNDVAAIRYASVYYGFKSREDFIKYIHSLSS